jgi:hypothetical protein
MMTAVEMGTVNSRPLVQIFEEIGTTTFDPNFSDS